MIDKIKSALKKEIQEQNYNTWFKEAEIEITGNTVTFHLENKFIKTWIQDNYHNQILDILKSIENTHWVLEYNIKNNKKTPKIETEKKTSTPKKKTSNYSDNFTLNKKYTFESFISGNSNQFAYAASYAVAEIPATTYNPLFIYGGVGLGKTHLLNAIGNKILRDKTSSKISYYTSEKFINELVNSIRYNKMNEFREKFRSIDILLLDDIQFIAGKERTQEEFFHTFNALYQNQKQIVVTSDKYPKEIPELEERLRSRFEWGLIADIQPPDIETKVAILRSKADENSIKLPEEILFYLANSFTTNIRELEGYLVRIGAYSSLTSIEINIDTVKNILKDIIQEKNKEITVEEIQKKICSNYNIKISELKSTKRLKTLVEPRQIAMYLSRKLTNLSLPEIGKEFGGKDHSTVIHAVKKIKEKAEKDKEFKNIITNLEKEINLI
jgi:chromosomal replication initiator protein